MVDNIVTPYKLQDIRKHTRLLRKRLNVVDKARMKMLYKTGKSLDHKNATIAVLQT